MKKVEVGKKVPNFCLAATSGLSFELNQYRGKKIVLYFYPKDNTPGCTQEGGDFRDLYREFSKINTVIFGISRDNVTSHEKFKSAQHYPFELLADVDSEVCAMFDVIKLKMMYGKQSEGIERSTFLIDEQGVLCHEWRKVKVAQHAQEVLTYIHTLKKT